MRKSFREKFSVKFLCLILIIQLQICFSTPSVSAAVVPLSLELATDILAGTAPKYNPNFCKENLTKDCPKETFKKPNVSRVLALHMISNAFGDMPIATTYYKNSIAPPDAPYKDVPKWAVESIEKLRVRGITWSFNNQRLGSNSDMYLGEFQRTLERIWRLYGSRLEDDFYETINKAWLNDRTNKGVPYASKFSELDDSNLKKFECLISELLAKEHPFGSKEQKICEYYKSFQNFGQRNEEGINPIKEYISMLDNVKNLNDLLNAENFLRRETGIQGVLNINVDSDVLGNGRERVVYFDSLMPILGKNFFNLENSEFGQLFNHLNMPFVSDDRESRKELVSFFTNNNKITAYKNYLTRLLILSGENKKNATMKANKIYEMEKNISSGLRGCQNMEDCLCQTDLSFLKEFYGFDISKTFADAGFLINQADKIIVCNRPCLDISKSYINDENSEILAAYLKLNFLISYSYTLSSDFEEAARAFYNKAFSFTCEKISNETVTLYYLMRDLAPYVNEFYKQKYVKQDAKRDIDKITKDILKSYKDTMKNVTWLTNKTKSKAVEKLKHLTCNFVFPDEIPDVFERCEFLPSFQSGSLFLNVKGIRAESQRKMLEKQKMPISESDIDEYFASVAGQVNAFYVPSLNRIFIPFGILGNPFYDEGRDFNKNLSGIGFIIGHEISHSFDAFGSMYDAYGNKANWWTEEDFVHFLNKCQDIKDSFDGIDIAKGISSDGTMTLCENFADLNGIRVSLDVLKTRSSYSLKEYFENYAKIWSEINTLDDKKYRNENDPHSDPRIRSNVVLKNIDEFYKCYDIKETDGMYTEPSKRIYFWCA